jgi:hypothetical protein
VRGYLGTKPSGGARGTEIQHSLRYPSVIQRYTNATLPGWYDLSTLRLQIGTELFLQLSSSSIEDLTPHNLVKGRLPREVRQLSFRGEHIAFASYCPDEATATSVRSEFLSQPCDPNINAAGGLAAKAALRKLEDLRPGHNSMRPSYEHLEKLDLRRSQADDAPVTALDLPGIEIESNSAERNGPGPALGSGAWRHVLPRRPPQDASNAGQELVQVIRLHDVIIGPDLKSENPVGRPAGGRGK